MISIADLRKLSGQSPDNRRLLVEAVLCLGMIRAAIGVLPFAWVARRLALESGNAAESATAVDPAARITALRIGRAVRTAASRTPWESKCLAQALSGALMLRRRHIPFVLTLGVARTEERKPGIDAHAWLFSGDVLLTGAGYERYSVLARFTSAMGR